MNLKIVVAILILALVIGAAYFISYPHPSTVTPVTNSQQAAQASTNASAAISQIGSTLDSIASKLG